MIEYKVEGCYKDRKGRNDTIFTKTFNTVKGVDRKNPDVEKIFLECKELAEKEGYEIFAIQVKVLVYNKYIANSRKVVGKNVHATIPRGSMGYVQYTVPDNVAVEPAFVAFL